MKKKLLTLKKIEAVILETMQGWVVKKHDLQKIKLSQRLTCNRLYNFVIFCHC